MFKNSKISRRLIVLISALTLTIVSIGGVTLVGMTGMVADTKILNVKTAEAAAFSRIAGSVRYHMLDVAQELSAGTLEWTQAERLLEAGSEEFERLWQAQQTVIASDPKNKEAGTTDGHCVRPEEQRILRRYLRPRDRAGTPGLY
jgi:hypothetical protein